MRLLNCALVFFFLLTLFLALPKPTKAATCAFSPTALTQGENLGVIINGFDSNPHTVKLVNFTTTIALGNVVGSGGTVTVSSSVPASEYQVRVESGFGGDITCVTASGPGNLTVTGAAPSSSVSIVVDDLRASFADVGPGVFIWTPSGSTAGRLFIGTNSTNPITGSTISYPVNTADGTLGVPQPADGVYYAAMYTGAYGEIRMSNITSFTIGSAGGISLNPPIVSGSTVIFTFTPSDGSFVIVADNDCPSMLSVTRDFDSGQIAPGITQTNWSSAPPGTYCAKIVKALSGETLSNVVSFSVEEPLFDVGPPPDPFNISDPGIFSPASRFQTFGQLATDVVIILVSIAGGLLLFFVALSGFKFATSSGDPKKIASANATLTYAIIGIAVVILAFVIVRILQFFLQSNVPVV